MGQRRSVTRTHGELLFHSIKLLVLNLFIFLFDKDLLRYTGIVTHGHSEGHSEGFSPDKTMIILSSSTQ